jgi:hypothetical protein
MVGSTGAGAGAATDDDALDEAAMDIVGGAGAGAAG